MENAILYKEINTVKQRFMQALEQFTPAQVNTVPFPGSWTPGQVADHILKAGTGTLQVLQGNTTAAHRSEIEKEPMLKAIFLDFNARYKSPEGIIPSNGLQDKTTIEKDLLARITALADIAQSADLAALCTTVDAPAFGTLTRAEWLYLFVYHTQRHARQLENIHKAMA